MLFSRLLERDYTPAHGGNREDPAPYVVRFSPLTSGEYAGLLGTMQAMARHAEMSEAEQLSAVQMWDEATAAALEHIIAVRDLLDERGEPVSIGRFKGAALKTLELRAELAHAALAFGSLDDDEGKA